MVRLRFIGGSLPFPQVIGGSTLNSGEAGRCSVQVPPPRPKRHPQICGGGRWIVSPGCAQAGSVYLFELLHFEDVVRLLTARFSMHSSRCISTRRNDQTEHPAARRVIPVL